MRWRRQRTAACAARGGRALRHDAGGGRSRTRPPSRRAVSFICYLNEPGWSSSDGGALRVHRGGDSADDEGGVADFLPESGSLVLFDSLAVEHEVLPTHRERTCLIGWFHTGLS